MATPTELSLEQCKELIAAGGTGRLAFCTPEGPRIYPVNFVVDGDSVVLRTSPYTELGTALAHGTAAAFEVDDLDQGMRQGWSVVAYGTAQPVQDYDDVALLRQTVDLEPWAGGARPLYIRLPWKALSGRRIGPA